MRIGSCSRVSPCTRLSRRENPAQAGQRVVEECRAHSENPAASGSQPAAYTFIVATPTLICINTQICRTLRPKLVLRLVRSALGHQRSPAATAPNDKPDYHVERNAPRTRLG